MPNFTLRYVTSLTIIALLVTGGYFLNGITQKTQLNDSRVINIAGRQRMLSQKISKVSLKIQKTIDEAERKTDKKELEEAVALWERSHNGLQEGDEGLGLPGGNSEVVKKLFVAIEPAYQEMLVAARSLVRELESGQSDVKVTAFVATVLSNEAVFLSGMDKIVFQYDKEAKIRVESLRQIDFLLFWTVFLTLIAEGVFILRPAVKRLKRADKLKDEFVSIASHQLRTPLTGIRWVVEMMAKKEKLTDKGREYLNDIQTSTWRLSRLVDLLLNTARIEEGQITIFPKPLDVVNFIKSFIDECAPICNKKKLAIKFTTDLKKMTVMTDLGAFTNIIQSVISNAIEYTLEGGRIEVKLNKHGQTFLVTVSDTGVGIPESEQKKIFQKFGRASNAQYYKTDGTGLGLWIAKRATEFLGGKIWFKSEENKGATFFVELPVESRSVKGTKKLV